MIKPLGDILKEAIEHKNLTQKQIAEYLHIAPQTLNSFVRNRRLPSLEIFAQLVQLLDLDAEYILGLHKPMYENTRDMLILGSLRNLTYEQKELVLHQVYYYQNINHIIHDLHVQVDKQSIIG